MNVLHPIIFILDRTLIQKEKLLDAYDIEHDECMVPRSLKVCMKTFYKYTTKHLLREILSTDNFELLVV